MDLDHIRWRFRVHRPRLVDDPAARRAAVLMIFRQHDGATELLFIQRAVRAGDPWSGQMALPGGRRQKDDVDTLATALREAREEVGIDLSEHGEVIGALDDLRAYTTERSLDLVISPYAGVITAPQLALVHDRNEVEDSVWVPLSHLCSPGARAVQRWPYNGATVEFPAYRYRHHVIWGITYQILQQLFCVCAGRPLGAAPATASQAPA